MSCIFICTADPYCRAIINQSIDEMVMGHLPLRLMVTTVEFIGHMAHMLSHHSDNLGNSQCCIVLRVSEQ